MTHCYVIGFDLTPESIYLNFDVMASKPIPASAYGSTHCAHAWLWAIASKGRRYHVTRSRRVGIWMNGG